MKRWITIMAALPLTGFFAVAAAPALAGSVIVQLEQPPGARYVAQERAAGRTVSDDALEAYRNALGADQDAFLEALEASGVSFTLETLQIPDFEGNLTPVQLRYTLVLNAVTLEVPESAVATIERMPQVRKVFPSRRFRLHLDNSVDYIRAPEVYGSIAELTAFDDFREGFEGQGINISVIDTGIEWSHEMFGADASPPRLGLQPPLAAANNNEKVIYYLPLHENAIDDFGHGTHASADAAGYRGFSPGADGAPLTGDEVPIHGVAPQARLMGYKVC
ncbi:MAG: S8 family serine peptidase, partial [Woeseiaceae bacterium]